MILYNEGANQRSFPDIADLHWQLLNPKRKADNIYKRNESLIGRVDKAIAYFINSNEKNKVKFLRYLQNQNYQQLEYLIKAPPKTLNKIIKKTDQKLKKYGLWQDKNFYGYLLESVFQYKNWRGNGKFELIFELLDIPVCPYCNIEEVHKDNNKNIVITSVDHYYDKANYPYLSLTFHNLVPVCYVCNHPYKGQTSFSVKDYLHPYVDDYDDLCSFQNTIVLNHQSPIEIKYKTQNIRGEAFNRDLGITERYNQPASLDEAKRIFFLHESYPESKKKELVSEWNLMTKEQVEQKICEENIIPYDKNVIRYKVRGKLKRDLAIKFGIISQQQ